jgi:hypothetical protein
MRSKMYTHIHTYIHTYIQVQEKRAANKKHVEDMSEKMQMLLITVKNLLIEDAKKYQSRFSNVKGAENAGVRGGESAGCIGEGPCAVVGRFCPPDLSAVHQKLLAGAYGKPEEVRIYVCVCACCVNTHTLE